MPVDDALDASRGGASVVGAGFESPVERAVVIALQAPSRRLTLTSGIAIPGAFPGGALRSMTGYVLLSSGCRLFLKRYRLCMRVMALDRSSGSPAAKGT
jgi:hypothetical protein